MKIILSQESCIRGIQINTNIGPLLMICVNMPINYGDASSLESYMDCHTKYMPRWLIVKLFTHLLLEISIVVRVLGFWVNIRLLK